MQGVRGTGWRAGIGMLLALSGCGATEEGGAAGLIARAKLDSGTPADSAPTDSGGTDPAPVVLENGPYSVGLSDTAARVWARLSGVGEARVALALDPDFTVGLTYSDSATSDPDSDDTLQWELGGLTPETTYYYQVLVDGAVAGPVSGGSAFTTFASPETVADFNFVVFSDQQSPNLSPAYEAAGLERPAFAFQIGDFDHRNPYDIAGLDIESWRAMHRENLFTDQAGIDLSENILLRTPFYHTWDDHDYGDNDADRTAPFHDIAMQAFREYFLTGELPNPDDGFWYSFRYGQAEFFVLDSRSQRDPNTSRNTRGKSMLGATQKAWLKGALKASTATWKFILSSSVWNPTSKPNDSWTNFPRERRELLTFFTLNRITGVVLLTGDIHSGGGIDDGTNSGVPEVTVPTTNMVGFGCTGTCGTWSEGLYDVYERNGYVNVTLSYDAGTGVHTCDINTLDNAGNVRVAYTLTR